MATELIMPTLPSEQLHQPPPSSRAFIPARPPHVRTQSYQLPPGPQLSPLSTSDNSGSSNSSPGRPPVSASTPASPNAHHARHLRPVYMPAVLRPNEFPTKRARCKPSLPLSDDAVSDRTVRRGSAGFMGMTALGQRLSRRSTGESGKSFDGEWDLDMFPQVKALPTREHWKPDPESSVCDDPTCKRNFSYFIRRHHCRKCGNIFCDWHSSYVVPLDQDGNFNPRAPPSRTCGHCFEMFKAWHSRNNSQTSSSASSDAPHTTPSTPIAAMPAGAAALAKSPDAAASVPRDWNWSTF